MEVMRLLTTVLSSAEQRRHHAVHILDFRRTESERPVTGYLVRSPIRVAFAFCQEAAEGRRGFVHEAGLVDKTDTKQVGSEASAS